jgi:hypothetical protein
MDGRVDEAVAAHRRAAEMRELRGEAARRGLVVHQRVAFGVSGREAHSVQEPS